MPLMPRKAVDPGAVQLGEPMVIVHREADGIQTMLFEFTDHGPEAFGLILADIAQHAANAYGTDVEYIMEWARKELDNPTTNYTRMGPN